jgi:penicillin-binding protein 1C
MKTAKKIFILQRRRRRREGSNLLLRLAIGTVATSILLTSLLFFSGIGTVIGIYLYFAKDLPHPRQIEVVEEGFETTKIYDRTGRTLLYEVFDPRLGDRTWVPLDQIPLYMRQATIAIEDRNFYKNPGIDLRGIARALYINILRRGPVQGASTITMQLVRNVLIPPEERYKKLYSRKIKEVILSLEISRRYSKDQILEWYLNTVFYGNLAYGVEAASKVYFGKSVEELDLAECAMLAALPQFPGINPIDAPEEARKRQHLVLDAMLRQGYITAEECVEAKFKEMDIKSGVEERFDIVAPHFSIYVRKLLEGMFGTDLVLRGGLRVYTTLDLKMQNLAERLAREHIANIKERDVSNASVVAIRPRTGEILVMVGSLDYWNEEIDGKVNMATSPRQPGSSFKPFTYVTAFSQGKTPATMVMDVRTAFPDPPFPPYVPANHDRKYHGPQRFRNALACSLNIPAVKVLSMTGVKNVLEMAHRMGITTLREDHYGLSLTLGGGEVKLLDMTYAYSVFANGGVMFGIPIPEEKRIPGYRELDPVAILRVEDRDGNIIWQYTSPEAKRVLSPQLAYLITDILSDNRARIPTFGYENKLQLSRPAAVKTGTTEDFRDGWTIGYTPQLVCGVWVGNTDNKPMRKVGGSRGAAPIWHGFMEEVLAPLPVENFERPPGLIDVEVCSISGELPNEHCPNKVKEIFIQGTEPTIYCRVHQVFKVNKETGKLATVYTPPELVEERVYEIYPPEAADWVRENNIPQPPTEYDDIYGPIPAGDVAILSPSPYAYISKGVVILGNAKSWDFKLYRLEYGQGLNPSAWSRIGEDKYYQVENGPLDFWDVSSLEGLYTLKLTVVEKSGNYKQSSIQVTVDNISPTVSIGHPYEGKVYVMEEDEWVNIQANATDNVSMDRVEFYLDERLIAISTVPPYNKQWTITMSDTIPIPGMVVTATQPITNPDGTISTEVITLTYVVSDTQTGALIQYFSNGMTIISDTHGYTETHLIHVVAFDSAGNKAESEKVRIYVIHKREEPNSSVALSSTISATSVFFRRGSASILPSLSMIVTRFVSTPKPLSGEVMSFATMRSSFFLSNLALAFSTKSSVSAANPTTTSGLAISSLLLATSDRMSGFLTNRRVISSLSSFLIFLLARFSTR